MGQGTHLASSAVSLLVRQSEMLMLIGPSARPLEVAVCWLAAGSRVRRVDKRAGEAVESIV
jgi:hypothetical protein